MKKLLTLALLSALLLSLQPVPAHAGIFFTIEKKRALEGEIITFTLHSQEGSPPFTMGDVWRVVDRRDGQEQSQYLWTEEETTVEGGETRVWEWEQNQGCYGQCQNVKYGEPSGPGRYYWEIVWPDGDTLSSPFDIGQFFTLGFESNPDTSFVVWVNTPEEVDQMEAEAAAKDKTLIVSGIVRRSWMYNRPWRYTMGSGSIVLGEAFIEVCDASSEYVQNHYRQWKGERWCPWSSYVEKVGR